jgi:hypothetical protein
MTSPKKTPVTRQAAAQRPAARRSDAVPRSPQKTTQGAAPATRTSSSTTRRPVADEAVRRNLASRLAQAVERGWTRAELANLAFGDPIAMYGIWRMQKPDRGGYAEHVRGIDDALKRIESGEVAPPARSSRAGGPSRADLQARITALETVVGGVRSLMDGVVQQPKVPAGERKLATAALDLLPEDDAR